MRQARIHIAQTAQKIHPVTDYLDEVCVVLHAYCRDGYTKYIKGNQGAVKEYFTAP